MRRGADSESQCRGLPLRKALSRGRTSRGSLANRLVQQSCRHLHFPLVKNFRLTAVVSGSHRFSAPLGPSVRKKTSEKSGSVLLARYPSCHPTKH